MDHFVRLMNRDQENIKIETCLLQYCTFNATSDKVKYNTFARTRPPSGLISKSVVSVLKTFNWTHVSKTVGETPQKCRNSLFQVVLLTSPDTEFGHIANTILHSLHSAGISVVSKTWESQFLPHYTVNPFHDLVEETFRETRSKFCSRGANKNSDRPHLFTWNFTTLVCRYRSAADIMCVMGWFPF